MNKDQQIKLWGLLKDIEIAGLRGRKGKCDERMKAVEQYVFKIMQPLQKDKTRLDWLADPSNHLGNVQLPAGAVQTNLDSLRNAIDATMEGKYPKQQPIIEEQ
jgi:hypothetical protein